MIKSISKAATTFSRISWQSNFKISYSQYPFLKELGLKEENYAGYYGGKWVADGETYDSVNPHDGKVYSNFVPYD